MTKSGTLVFVWKLELPKHIPVSVAANAMLSVALAVPRERWHRQQLLIMKELMVLADENERDTKQNGSGARKLVTSGRKPTEKTVSGLERLLQNASNSSKSTGARAAPVKSDHLSSEDNVSGANLVRPAVERDAPAVETELEMIERKKSKDWWYLVGSGAKKPVDKN